LSEAKSTSAAERRSAFILAGAALLFSAMALCAKAVSSRLPAPEIAWMRFLMGLGSIMVPISLGYRLRPVNYGSLILRGLFGGMAVLLYFQALAHLPVGIATLLNSSWPVFVALFSFLFLHEPMGFRPLLALLVTSIGVLLIVLGSSLDHSPGGDVTRLGTSGLIWGCMGLCSAIFSAAAVTTIRSMRKKEGSWEIFLAFSLIGTVVTGVPSAIVWVTPTTTDLIWLSAMGLCSILAQMGMTHALRDLRAVTAGIILQLTPIATLILGIVFFADRPTPLGWFGALVTLLGVTWGTVAR
jgi:drug/metabolite transporter (DMT)-like permease